MKVRLLQILIFLAFSFIYGNAKVGTILKKLDFYSLGSGDLYYKGKPSLSTKILGTGELLRE